MIKSKGQTPLKQNNKELLFTLEESIPKEQTERKKYVSDIAFFYATIFKKKLEHFIGLQLLELSQIGRTEENYKIIRANINCFRLIQEWMEEITNEHMGNLNEVRNSFDDGKDFLEKIKIEYK